MSAPAGRVWRGWDAVVVAGTVIAATAGLVAVAGTDAPFQDQWDAEGRTLLPAWSDGTWRFADLFQPHNEHRIFWTQLLNLTLFATNGQWDPLVQQLANAGLRGLVAAAVFGTLATGVAGWFRLAAMLAAIAAFLPAAAWHNALWGFQSHVLFVLLFGVVAVRCLTNPPNSPRQQTIGILAAIAAMLAMGPGLLLPASLMVVAAWQVRESTVRRARPLVAAGALLVAAGALALTVAASPDLGAAHSVGSFLRAVGRALAWPHTAQPWAAGALNAPFAIALVTRALRWRRPAIGEDGVTALALWAVGIAIAAAWRRGGAEEWTHGVPSRYADFFVLLPLANGWFAWTLLRGAVACRRVLAVVALAWTAFALVGWAGLSAEMVRRVIIPRARDRDAPVRLVLEFQRTGHSAVFAGQPRLLVPHPNPGVVRAVLADARLEGKLPPSLQPQRPMGPLSRAARRLLGRQ